MRTTSNKWRGLCSFSEDTNLVGILSVCLLDIKTNLNCSAIEAYKQAENRSESADWEILHNLGMCHLYMKEWDQARECLDKALSLSKHQQTFTVLGRVYLMSGDVPGAVNVYKEAVKLDLSSYYFIVSYSELLKDIS